MDRRSGEGGMGNSGAIGARNGGKWERQKTYLAEKLFSPRTCGGEDHPLPPQRVQHGNIKWKGPPRRGLDGWDCWL